MIEKKKVKEKERGEIIMLTLENLGEAMEKCGTLERISLRDQVRK